GDQREFAMTFGAGLTNYASTNTTRNDERASNASITHTLSLQWGGAGMRFGAAFDQIDYSNVQYTVAPSIVFGLQSSLDPADSLFSDRNFPGASATDLANARAIYALLTGRVTAINATARLTDDGEEYTYLGTLTDRTRM